jgi:hypothetical protein
MTREGRALASAHLPAPRWPVFLWKWDALPDVKWSDLDRPVPLLDMTLVATAADEDLPAHKLWIERLPLGTEHVIVRPWHRQTRLPAQLFAEGQQRHGYVYLYLDEQCRLRHIQRASTHDW